MLGCGESQKEAIRPDFNRAIMIDFQGTTISSDTGFIPLREVDERFKIIDPMKDCLEDLRSPAHTKHALVQMVRQRVYQIAAGYEDCNDADFLRVDPALRLDLGKDHRFGASQSMLSLLENDVLGNAIGLEALDSALIRSTDAMLKRKNKKWLIIDLDSTEDPAHGKQEGVAFNGHFSKNFFHPLFGFSSDGDCLGAKLRPGNVHSADDALEFVKPILKRYRPWFKLFWLRGDAAFAKPEIYEYCEEQRITFFIRLPANDNLDKLVAPHLNRPVGRPPKSGIQIKVVDLQYQAKSWHKPRRVVAKIEWHRGGLFPRINFVVTNSRLSATKVVKVYNGRGDVENRIKEGKNTLRWDKTSCQRFESNQARLKMGVLAYNLLHMIRQFYVWGEEVKLSMDWLIKRLIKVGARISYHAWLWYIHVASAFPLAEHYRTVLAWSP